MSRFLQAFRWPWRRPEPFSLTATAQGEDMNHHAAASALVEEIVERLASRYIFPDRAAKAASLLRANRDAGAYDLPIGPDLCQRLSADLFTVCEDQHLRLIWYESPEASQDEASLVATLREMFRLENQGIRRVERLRGNVGLIELTLIPEAVAAGPAITAAMQLVQHTHALILDLRGTRGGAPDGVALLCSFLFPGEPVHLNDLKEGADGTIHQFWTMAYVPGPQYDKPVYVLTSTQTFSGGEELAYDLQALGRATVVGEVTRGGAHPSAVVPVREHIELRLPIAQAVNPVTGGDWEAVGVQPNIVTPANDALAVAHRLALEAISTDLDAPDASRAEARQSLGTP